MHTYIHTYIHTAAALFIRYVELLVSGVLGDPELQPPQFFIYSPPNVSLADLPKCSLDNRLAEFNDQYGLQNNTFGICGAYAAAAAAAAAAATAAAAAVLLLPLPLLLPPLPLRMLCVLRMLRMLCMLCMLCAGLTS
jgi:hypothetical protein